MGRENLPNAETLRFGFAIELRRTVLRMKRRDLAERSELSYPYVSEIEKGMKEPSAKSLRQLAMALEFDSVSDLMSFVEQQPLQGEEATGSPEWVSAGMPSSSSESWAFAATPSMMSSPSPARDGAIDDALERLARRLVDEVLSSLRQEIPRLVESEVSRQLSERRDLR